MKNKMLIFFNFFCIVIGLISFQPILADTSYYGAIYVDETTGISGSSWNYETSSAAKKVALNFCKKKSKKNNCEFISGWSNSCSAAAWSPKKKSARRGELLDDQKLAEKSALEVCRRVENDLNCKIVASVCTNWETIETRTVWW